MCGMAIQLMVIRTTLILFGGTRAHGCGAVRRSLLSRGHRRGRRGQRWLPSRRATWYACRVALAGGPRAGRSARCNQTVKWNLKEDRDPAKKLARALSTCDKKTPPATARPRHKKQAAKTFRTSQGSNPPFRPFCQLVSIGWASFVVSIRRSRSHGRWLPSFAQTPNSYSRTTPSCLQH